MSQHVEAIESVYARNCDCDPACAVLEVDYCSDELVAGLDAPDGEDVLYIGTGETALVIYGTSSELQDIAARIVNAINAKVYR